MLETNGHKSTFVAVPPLAIVMNQQMKEEEVLNANGEKSITMKLERNLCGMSPSISQESVTLHLFDISTTLQSATDRKFLFAHNLTFMFSMNFSCLKI
jgi:hypothetical protein